MMRLSVAMAPILWGTTYIITTELLPDNRPLLVATVRALPIGILFVAANRQLPQGIWWWRALVLGVLNIGLFFSLLFVATFRIPGGIVATIGAFQPLIVLIFSALLLNDSPPKLTYLLAGIGVIGVSLLVLTSAAELDVVGISAAVGAAFSMAVGVVLTKQWERSVSLTTFTGWQLIAGGLFLALLTILFERQPLGPLTNLNIVGFLWLALLNTGLAYMLWFKGIEQLSPWQVSILGLLSPVVAVLAGFLLLNENLTGLQILGVVLIFSAIVTAQWHAHRHERP
ncbi:MAG: EamA family transporter [Chloroflexota bacterium]